MAIYKLFPSQDATIYSRYPNKNTGLNEILSVNIEDSQNSGNTQAARTLIQFSSTEIADVINNKISGSIWSASLKGFISEINGLNSDTTIEVYAVTGSWDMGTGKYSYDPEYTNGVSWYNRLSSGSGAWRIAGFPAGVTGSYGSVSGGGNWYTSSYTQSFSYYDDKDINIDVTPIVRSWYSSSIANNGFIIKQAVEFVDNLLYNINIDYFSRDTHTIYPPQLELKWRDYSFNTGSLTELTSVLNKKVTAEEVNAAMKKASDESFGYTEDELVSTDIIGISYGSLFDATQTKVMTQGDVQLVKTVSWYDNEMSYVSQLVRTVKYFAGLISK
jgi:hypothetical protein